MFCALGFAILGLGLCIFSVDTILAVVDDLHMCQVVGLISAKWTYGFPSCFLSGHGSLAAIHCFRSVHLSGSFELLNSTAHFVGKTIVKLSSSLSRLS